MERIRIAGFDWDDGNREKCQRHGVPVEEIEDLFSGTVAIQPDPSTGESRLRAIGRTARSRHVFLVFTLRQRNEGTFIRPISARYMHAREVQRYEEAADPAIQD